MNWKLSEITDWSERAQAAEWCVVTLARDCGVSISILERHFRKSMGRCPQVWLRTDRLARAPALLAAGASVKEVSDQLWYKNQHHFSRAFKQQHSYAPSEHQKRTSPVLKPLSVALRISAWLFCSVDDAGLWFEPTYWCL